MEKNKTLKENINWLLNRYRMELTLEEEKDIDDQDLYVIETYTNIIIELEYALKISKED